MTARQLVMRSLVVSVVVAILGSASRAYPADTQEEETIPVLCLEMRAAYQQLAATFATITNSTSAAAAADRLRKDVKRLRTTMLQGMSEYKNLSPQQRTLVEEWEKKELEPLEEKMEPVTKRLQADPAIMEIVKPILMEMCIVAYGVGGTGGGETGESPVAQAQNSRAEVEPPVQEGAAWVGASSGQEVHSRNIAGYHLEALAAVTGHWSDILTFNI